jgi:hypothetical protein
MRAFIFLIQVLPLGEIAGNQYFFKNFEGRGISETFFP